MERIGSWDGPGVRPIILGESKTPALAYLVGGLGLGLTGFVTTEVCAASHMLTSTLGPAIAHLPLVGKLYAPWAFGPWIWGAMHLVDNLSMVARQVSTAQAAATAAQQAYLAGPVCFSLGGGLGGSLLSAIAVTELSKWRAKDEITTITDTAHFATVDEIRAKTNFLTANCGPIFGDVVTVLEKRFGPFVIRPEVREHLRWDGETGWNTVGIAGRGKSAELKTNLLIPLVHPQAETWSDVERRAHPFGYEPNIVALDTKGDLRRSTSGYQKHVLGKNVFVFSPFSTDPGKAHIDTLHLIRIGTIHEFDDCRRAGVHIVDEGQGVKNHWDKTALDFLGGIIGRCGYEALSRREPWRLSHPGIIDFVTRFTKPEQLIAFMTAEEHDPHSVFGWRDDDGEPTKHNPWILRVTNAMAAKESEEASGVYSTLLSYIGQFLSAVIRLHISESTFDIKAAANDPKKASILYIDMPSADLEQFRGYIRIMFRSFFSQLMSGTVTIAGRELPANLRTTMLFMDEIKTLNRLEPLAESSGNMRGYKVQVYAIWQERGQIEECYGKTESLTGNLGLQKYYAMPPGDDSAWLSKKCGQTTKTIKHRNASGYRFSGPMGNLAENVQTVTVDNLSEYQARNIPADESIVFARGLQIRAKQVRYYENDELDRRSKMPPVELSDTMVRRPFFECNLESQIGPERYATLTSSAPDRWKEKREAAKVDEKSGCRIHQWETTDKKTHARRFFAVLWLPSADDPVFLESFPTAAERKTGIEKCIKVHTGADDADKVQVPHTEGQPAKAVFKAAIKVRRG